MSDLPILLPCPFCGGEVKFEQTLDTEIPSLWWYVACSGEDCPIRSESLCLSARRTEAAKLWNVRPIEDKNVFQVREKLLARSRLGTQKYGVTTDKADLTKHEWLIHLQEELMDAIVYIEAQL